MDVENSSRADHVSRVLDHLAIDRQDRRVDLIAVGNWRVIGADSARLLARLAMSDKQVAALKGDINLKKAELDKASKKSCGSAAPGPAT